MSTHGYGRHVFGDGLGVRADSIKRPDCCLGHVAHSIVEVVSSPEHIIRATVCAIALQDAHGADSPNVCGTGGRPTVWWRPATVGSVVYDVAVRQHTVLTGWERSPTSSCQLQGQ